MLLLLPSLEVASPTYGHSSDNYSNDDVGVTVACSAAFFGLLHCAIIPLAISFPPLANTSPPFTITFSVKPSVLGVRRSCQEIWLGVTLGMHGRHCTMMHHCCC
jgi:hypothetical protein